MTDLRKALAAFKEQVESPSAFLKHDEHQRELVCMPPEFWSQIAAHILTLPSLLAALDEREILLGLPMAKVTDAIAALKRLSPADRVDVFGAFCRYCGSDQPDCKCWNDE